MASRAYGSLMAKLYKRGKVWWFQFRNKRQSTRCTDRTAAALVARDIERRAADPTYRPPNATTLGAALQAFCELQRERGKAEGTLKMYDRHIRHIARLLGQRTPLASIEAPELDGYTSARLAEGAARTSVGKELSTIRGTLRLARRRKQYPFALEEVMPSGFALEYVPGTAHLKEAQVERLLAVLPPKRRAFVAFIVATGADLACVELARRTDINFRSGTVKVHGSKTRHRKRELPILAPFEELLRFAAQYLPFEPWGNVRRDLTVACKRARVPRVTPRDLRRTHGAILRQLGVEPHLIGKMLGHGDSRMVERVYGPIPADSLGELISLRIGTRTVHGTENEGGAAKRSAGHTGRSA